MTPNFNIDNCSYHYGKLKDVIYLISEDAVKNIHIDNGAAYVDGLLQLPIRLNGYNIKLDEQSSLDERYRFQKTLTLSMHGYVNHTIFQGRYYAIVENESGERYLINVDFGAKLTFTFHLDRTTNSTDFTLYSLSNFPTLKLNADFEAVAPPCLGYNVHGIEKLQLLEFDKAKLDTINKVVMSTEAFKLVDCLKNSCSFQEVYDGSKITDTISFNLPLEKNMLSDAWNMLEFMENRYTAIITPLSDSNKYYIGFNFGLEPVYNIKAVSQNNESDIVTITLTEVSVHGMIATDDWDDEQVSTTQWHRIKQVGNLICWECVGLNEALYLVQQEVDAFGIPTGNYKVLEGYESQFEDNLNVVGTFTEEELFANAACAQVDVCELNTNIPNSITFTAVTSNTYYLTASCDWQITNIPSNLSISPVSGVANSGYVITISNTYTPSSSEISNHFFINCCVNRNRVNVLTKAPSSCIRPLVHNINCLAQTVTFAFDGTCVPTITSATLGLTYSIQGNTITVNVPKSIRDTSRQYTLTVANCNCSEDDIVLTINQDKCYSQWLVDGNNFECASGNSYAIERKYTGATSNNINNPTDETRRGSMISSGDSRCRQVMYKFNGHYICVEGNKFELIEEFELVDGVLTPTGSVEPGDMVEENSSFCEDAQEGWQLTNQFICQSTE